jgi:Flp pilus assembly protein TadG
MRKLIRSCSGQSLLEFALLFPLMFLLLANVVNFGGLLYAYITVANASRSGASYMIMGPSSIGSPILPPVSAVQAVVNADLSSLPYAGNATVSVCSNNGGSASYPETCLPPTDPATGTTFADPQPGTSVLGTVQVQYRYCPFIPSWNFPALGIYSTLPSCTFAGGSVTGGGTLINRVAVMRKLQ